MERAKQIKKGGIAWRQAMAQAWREYKQGIMPKPRMGSIGKVPKAKKVKADKPVVKKVIKVTKKTERYNSIGSVALSAITRHQQERDRYLKMAAHEMECSKKKGITARDKAQHKRAAEAYKKLAASAKQHITAHKRFL